MEHVLAPTLEPGRLVVMDNLCAHKGARVKEIIEGMQAPSLAALLAGLQSDRAGLLEGQGVDTQSRGAHPRALIGAMDRALEAVSAQDARGFFGHCGYRSMGQPL